MAFSLNPRAKSLSNKMHNPSRAMKTSLFFWHAKKNPNSPKVPKPFFRNLKSFPAGLKKKKRALSPLCPFSPQYDHFFGVAFF